MTIYNGGTLGPGFTGKPGDIFIGVKLKAVSNFDRGSTFINCTFACKPGLFGGCSGQQSNVGPGATMKGGFAGWVRFHPKGVLAGVAQGPQLLAPSCVDCAPAGNIKPPAAPADTMVLAPEGFITYEEWCAKACKPGDDSTIILGKDVDRKVA